MTIIRDFAKKDISEAAYIWNSAIMEGNSLPQEHPQTEAELLLFFSEQTRTAVADMDGKIVGLYILHPNNVGRCSHIANASYVVDASCRGQHIGEKLVKDSLIAAANLGFRILQFNAVVASNHAAHHLYKKLGFTALGSIPGGYRMDNGYEDIIPYYIELGE